MAEEVKGGGCCWNFVMQSTYTHTHIYIYTYLCVANTWLRKADKEKVTYGSGCKESEIDFCIMGKVERKFLRNVKVNIVELQHSLTVVDEDKNKK